MTQNIRFCSVLWIIVAIIAAHTAAMDTNTTTANTTTPSATEAPANTTTPVNTTTSSTTGAPGNTTTPVNTTTPATTAVPGTTTAVPDPCASNPCGKGSTCEARANKGFVCLCLAGDNYNNKTHRCDPAKVFPGQIQPPDIPYENSMSDKASPAFKRTADLITQELDKSLGSDPTYVRSIVLELRPAVNRLLRMSPGIDATIEIIYSPESNITASDVVAEVKKATECTNCSLAGGTFTEEDLCKRNACDEVTASCFSGDGTFTCTCKNEYVPNDFSTRACRACPSGQKAENSKCVSCPFGYSGLNCNESTVLILVIVGSVLGGLLLISFILLIAVLSKKSSQKNKQAVTGTPPATFANARMDRNLSLDDQEYEIMPYAQSQLQNNPYGRSQGHTNHYYN
ncbi:mucin-13-like [Mugil cephalus]|uniref:mucin-13-like n=1 Tax=Mugil cephalus TaxID=48193 RepID=UPI001FB61A18|nr:mucin-13-like [Mugil cephalus]